MGRKTFSISRNEASFSNKNKKAPGAYPGAGNEIMSVS